MAKASEQAGWLDLHFATTSMQTPGSWWISRVFLKMMGGGKEERAKRKRESRERRDDRTSESVSRMHTHTRGPALVKRSAIPRDIVPALNQVRLPLNCWLTLSQVHGRIRKTKESLTSTATTMRMEPRRIQMSYWPLQKWRRERERRPKHEEEIEPDSTRNKPGFPFLFLKFRVSVVRWNVDDFLYINYVTDT